MEGQRKKILITGVSGLLGSRLAQYFKGGWDILGTYYTYPVNIEGITLKQIDLGDEERVKEMVEAFRADVIIHCAALTNIEYCEDHQDAALRANVTATKNLVEGIRGSDTKFIYISTDAVFDGEKGNYAEEDEVNPLSFYGSTKYKGELEALKNDNALVARTNIFGRNIQPKLCLAEWIVDELSKGRAIKGFTDVLFSSVYTGNLALLLEAAITKDLKGVYHFTAGNAMSKYDFAVRLAERLELNPELIEPISVDDFAFKAKRSKDLSMNSEKLKADIGRDIPFVEESIEHFVHDFQKVKHEN